MKPILRGPELYCITDQHLCPLPLVEQVRQMAEGGARIIQLRAKGMDWKEVQRIAKECAAIAREHRAIFIVNDDAKIANVAGADGVHLGQDDDAPMGVRHIVTRDALIGVSTHTRAQFMDAVSDSYADYIALGPVFGTTTKANADPPPGFDLIEEAAAIMEKDGRPLVLIGGITLENLPQVRKVAPNAIIAVIGGILKQPPIAERIAEFREALGMGYGV
ncbi:thiamine phosphate synthase [soil metagenome]